MSFYLEELAIGDCFVQSDKYFIVTSDFKKNGERYCLDVTTGLFKWFSASTIVDKSNLYVLDSNNNFSPVKHETNIESLNIHQNKNIS
jgi:hypothetical protein